MVVPVCLSAQLCSFKAEHRSEPGSEQNQMVPWLSRMRKLLWMEYSQVYLLVLLLKDVWGLLKLMFSYTPEESSFVILHEHRERSHSEGHLWHFCWAPTCSTYTEEDREDAVFCLDLELVIWGYFMLEYSRSFILFLWKRQLWVQWLRLDNKTDNWRLHPNFKIKLKKLSSGLDSYSQTISTQHLQF